jgi:hypothetical protein
MALRVDREVCDLQGKVILEETRYFVTNLSPDVYSAKSLLDYVRGHWQVENCLHFILDRWWDQDRHYAKRPGLAERRAMFSNMALTLLRLTDFFQEDLPIRARADELAWSPDLLLQLFSLSI